ncbi:MAG: XRE family transcriptional regulator [Sphingomonas sp.]
MPVRSYEHFETGKGRITFERLARFAEVTKSDPIALLAVVPTNSPEFALRCADNKLMQILMIALSELNEDLSDDIVYLESALIIGGITRLCKELTEHVGARDTFAETWLERKSSTLPGMVSARKPRGKTR